MLGRIPSSITKGEENIGTKNYGKKPVAILAGGAFSDEDVAIMQEAILKEVGREGSNVPWFRADTKNYQGPGGPAYGAQVAQRSKDKLKEVLGSGESVNGGVYWY